MQLKLNKLLNVIIPSEMIEGDYQDYSFLVHIKHRHWSDRQEVSAEHIASLLNRGLVTTLTVEALAEALKMPPSELAESFARQDQLWPRRSQLAHSIAEDKTTIYEHTLGDWQRFWLSIRRKGTLVANLDQIVDNSIQQLGNSERELSRLSSELRDLHLPLLNNPIGKRVIRLEDGRILYITEQGISFVDEFYDKHIKDSDEQSDYPDIIDMRGSPNIGGLGIR